jgi:predicted dehydrogenase
MEFVTIVTPNYLHLPVAIAALRSGFHVLSDKPATISLDQCFALRDAVKQSNLLYGITHAYACYPLVVEARDLIASGRMGRIRKVIVEYTKGSLAQPLERLGNLRAQRRLDPAWTGPSCCFGDIGVHAFHLAEFVTGLDVVELSADLNHVVEDRAVDDDGTALLRFRNNAHGILIASLICTGEENDLSLRVYGEKAGLAWKQMEPNSLWLKHPDRPAELLRAGSSYLSDTARAHGRLAPGHPEGFIEAFANLYRGFGAKVRAYAAGDTSLHSGPGPEVPGIRTALRGMAFVETAIKASNSTDKWHRFPEIDS